MSIIYLKNPRSGSHFRYIGGTKGGRPMRAARRGFKTDRRGIRSVGWASCNSARAKRPEWPQYSGGLDRKKKALNFPTWWVASAEALFTFGKPIGRGAYTPFSKPCR